MADLNRVFLGFCVKQPWVPSEAWFPAAETGVQVVCSVSACLAERPRGWMDRWDFNRARCYDSEAAALATIPAGEETRHLCFAYHLISVRLSAEGSRVLVVPDELFDERLPPLPASNGSPGNYVRLGYDAVSVGVTKGFECSPLSCNGMATEIPVNRYCLLDRLDQALDVAMRFDVEQPEPGAYVVVEVHARRSDIARFNPPTHLPKSTF